jgi:hypothetical protein
MYTYKYSLKQNSRRHSPKTNLSRTNQSGKTFHSTLQIPPPQEEKKTGEKKNHHHNPNMQHIFVSKSKSPQKKKHNEKWERKTSIIQQPFSTNYITLPTAMK